MSTSIERLIEANIMMAEDKGWYATEFYPPTANSIAIIQDHFGIKLPDSLIQFLSHHRTCSMLASFGEDYDSAWHVLNINARCKRYRRRIIGGQGRWENTFPRNLIAINVGPDEDYMCFVKDLYDESNGEYMIAYWAPPRMYDLLYENFVDYMTSNTLHWASKSSRFKIEEILGIEHG